MNPPCFSYEWVDHPAKLQEVIDKMHLQVPVMLDTEADSFHHYYPQLCLVQVTINQKNWLLDPLQLDLTPFIEALTPKQIVFHAADYDLRLLWNKFRFKPQNLEDTSIAAQMCGEEQLGLGDLVQRYFGVKLEKANQKANWSQRPLAESLIDYAVSDTAYLMQLHEILQQKLHQLGRTQWYRQSCDQLVRHCCTDIAKQEKSTPWRVRGSGCLNPNFWPQLQSFWEWREAIAATRNRPPFKVLTNEKMIQIIQDCNWKQLAVEAVEQLKLTLPRSFSDQEVQLLVEKLMQSITTKEAPITLRKPKRIKSQIAKPHPGLYEKVRLKREELALELHVSPHLLANRSQISWLASAKGYTREQILACGDILPWQWELFWPLLQSYGAKE
jgi:ribonuclease D